MKEKAVEIKKREFPELDYLDFFVTPFHLNSFQEEELIKVLPEQKYEHVVVVGRFQPLHYGHVYLIRQAMRMAQQITIGIGSANIRNVNNPFSSEQREYMLSKVFKEERATGKIRDIVSLDDNEDDMNWINNTIQKTKKVDAVVGNNDWVNNCFEILKIPSIKVPLLQRGIYEGSKIRKFLRSVNKL